jgi:hypothetical protein
VNGRLRRYLAKPDLHKLVAMFSNSAAAWAFIGIIISIIVIIAVLLFLKYCYFPGGYKRNEVMDIGEYAIFIAQVRHEERRTKKGQDDEKEFDEYSELYQEMDPRTDDDGGRRVGGEDWRSEAASERDIERYDDGTSSPSARSMSEAGTRYDGQSVLSLRPPNKRIHKGASSLP